LPADDSVSAQLQLHDASNAPLDSHPSEAALAVAGSEDNRRQGPNEPEQSGSAFSFLSADAPTVSLSSAGAFTEAVVSPTVLDASAAAEGEGSAFSFL
jgi:hypothetical protein